MLKLLQLIGRQDWISFGVRDRIIRKICNPDNIGSQEFEVEFFGSIYKGNLNCYLDWMVYFYGAYEKHELYMLRDILKNKIKPVFIDIGANIGHHSLYMSGYSEQIHAFEPYEIVSKHLEMKILHNKIQNIHVHKVGLGKTDCELDYYAPKGPNTGTGSFVSSHAVENNEHFGKLKIVNADKQIAELSLDHIDLIKMDVEGFEKNVLMGMSETLKRFRPILFMEYSSDTRNSFAGEKELMSMLPVDYCVKLVRTNKTFMFIFNKPDSSYEDFNFNATGGNIIFFPMEEARKFGLMKR